jgi:hypothetical protein
MPLLLRPAPRRRSRTSRWARPAAGQCRGRRSAYLLLLIENPPALADLTASVRRQPLDRRTACGHPALLDELLDRASLYTAPEREALQAELRQQTSRLARWMISRATWRPCATSRPPRCLRVAASELAGRLPLMKVSDKLSFIAEVCLEQVLALAWAQLVARHGEPRGRIRATAFAMLGLRQARRHRAQLCLGPRSGVRLRRPANGYTNGERSIDNATFYTRLGQRMIHILETRMSLGQLYEVDMRLRPPAPPACWCPASTASSSTSARRLDLGAPGAGAGARHLPGTRSWRARFETLRRDLLCSERDARQLAQEVVPCAKKCAGTHGVSGGDDELDLKQGFGGIVDIEFMVQYAVLAWAARDEPELARLVRQCAHPRPLAADTGRRAREQCRRTERRLPDPAQRHAPARASAAERKVPAEHFAKPEPVCSVRRAWAPPRRWTSLNFTRNSFGSAPRRKADNRETAMNFADRDGTIWFDGEMVPWREAKVHVLTHTLHYGLGVFEGVRAYNTPDRGPVFSGSRSTRSACSTRRRFWPWRCPTDKRYADRGAARRGARKRAGGGLPAAHVFLRLRGYGSARRRAQDPRDGRGLGVAFVHGSGGGPSAASRCAPRPSRGTTSTSPCARPRRTAITSTPCWRCARRWPAGAEEALMLDNEGYVAEGSGENVFIVRRGKIHTPELTSCLDGITRATVFALAEELGHRDRRAPYHPRRGVRGRRGILYRHRGGGRADPRARRARDRRGQTRADHGETAVDVFRRGARPA